MLYLAQGMSTPNLWNVCSPSEAYAVKAVQDVHLTDSARNILQRLLATPGARSVDPE
jgi:hypothetical protein